MVCHLSVFLLLHLPASVPQCTTVACCRRHRKACAHDRALVSNLSAAAQVSRTRSNALVSSRQQRRLQRRSPVIRRPAATFNVARGSSSNLSEWISDELGRGSIVLNDGFRMPRFGLGTAAGDRAGPALSEALRSGYRLIDTAVAYHCEQTVAAAIAAVKPKRAELFVVSKAWPFIDYKGKDRVHKAAVDGASLKRSVTSHLALLGIGYIDLLLLHWPTPRLAEHWDALCELQRAGVVRSLGLSNVGRSHLELLANASIQPVLVQTELAPVATDRRLHSNLEELVEYCDARGEWAS